MCLQTVEVVAQSGNNEVKVPREVIATALPVIPPVEMAALQEQDRDIGRLREYWGRKKKPNKLEWEQDDDDVAKLIRQ